MGNKDSVNFLHNQFISLIYTDSESLLVSADELNVQKKEKELNNNLKINYWICFLNIAFILTQCIFIHQKNILPRKLPGKLILSKMLCFHPSILLTLTNSRFQHFC